MHVLKFISVSWSNRDGLGDMPIHIFYVYRYLQFMHCFYLLVAPEAHKNTSFFSSRMLLYWILPLAQKYSEFLQDTLGTSMPVLSFAKIHSPALSLQALQIPGCSCLQGILFCDFWVTLSIQSYIWNWILTVILWFPIEKQKQQQRPTATSTTTKKNK